MRENIRTFRDLRVYQQAFEAALRVYELTDKFPDTERYRLTSQIIRSSSAVGAIIAEAWRRRRYEKAWISKLNESEGEGAETQHWLALAERRGYISREQFQALDAEFESIQRQLVVMITRSSDWVLR